MQDQDEAATLCKESARLRIEAANLIVQTRVALADLQAAIRKRRELVAGTRVVIATIEQEI